MNNCDITLQHEQGLAKAEQDGLLRLHVQELSTAKPDSTDRSIGNTLTCIKTTQSGSIDEGSSATEGDVPDRQQDWVQRAPAECSPATVERSERDRLRDMDAFPDTSCKQLAGRDVATRKAAKEAAAEVSTGLAAEQVAARNTDDGVATMEAAVEKATDEAAAKKVADEPAAKNRPQAQPHHVEPDSLIRLHVRELSRDMDAFPDTGYKLELGADLYVSGLDMLQIGLALTSAEIIGDDEAGEKETNKTPEFLKTSRRGSDATDSAQVVQWKGMADNKIQPDSCTWVFITMGFIQSNKNTTDRAKSILVGDHLSLADNARA